MKPKVLKKLIEAAYDSEDSHDLLLDYIDNHDFALKPSKKINYVGIEIECFSQKSDVKLQEILLEMDLEKYVTIGGDSSIDDPYRDQGIELRCLIPENKLDKILPKIGKALKKHKCEVNLSCGLHIHLDMRNRKVIDCYKKLVKFQDIMYGLVKTNRWANEMCYFTHKYTKSRYTAVNLNSYNKHKTIEVRLHHGTVDVKEIQNWINLLLKCIKNTIIKDVASKEDVIKWAGKDKKIQAYVKKKYNKDFFIRKEKIIDESFRDTQPDTLNPEVLFR